LDEEVETRRTRVVALTLEVNEARELRDALRTVKASAFPHVAVELLNELTEVIHNHDDIVRNRTLRDSALEAGRRARKEARARDEDEQAGPGL
jgi:hypothetical protein